MFARWCLAPISTIRSLVSPPFRRCKRPPKADSPYSCSPCRISSKMKYAGWRRPFPCPARCACGSPFLPAVWLPASSARSHRNAFRCFGRRTPAWKRKLRKAVLSASSGSIIPCSAKARTCPGTTPSFCGPCRRGAARLPAPDCPLICWNGFPSACCGSCPAFPEWFTT